MLALACRDLAQDRSNRVRSPIDGTLRQQPLLEGRWQIERMGDNVRVWKHDKVGQWKEPCYIGKVLQIEVVVHHEGHCRTVRRGGKTIRRQRDIAYLQLSAFG